MTAQVRTLEAQVEIEECRTGVVPTPWTYDDFYALLLAYAQTLDEESKIINAQKCKMHKTKTDTGHGPGHGTECGSHHNSHYIPYKDWIKLSDKEQKAVIKACKSKKTPKEGETTAPAPTAMVTCNTQPAVLDLAQVQVHQMDTQSVLTEAQTPGQQPPQPGTVIHNMMSNASACSQAASHDVAAARTAYF